MRKARVGQLTQLGDIGQASDGWLLKLFQGIGSQASGDRLGERVGLIAGSVWLLTRLSGLASKGGLFSELEGGRKVLLIEVEARRRAQDRGGIIVLNDAGSKVMSAAFCERGPAFGGRVGRAVCGRFVWSSGSRDEFQGVVENVREVMGTGRELLFAGATLRSLRRRSEGGLIGSARRGQIGRWPGMELWGGHGHLEVGLGWRSPGHCSGGRSPPRADWELDLRTSWRLWSLSECFVELKYSIERQRVK